MSNWQRRKKKKPKPIVSDDMMLWLAKNRGVLTDIADKVRPYCTPQFVCMVARGLRKSKGGQVERLLREKGAPLKPSVGSPVVSVDIDHLTKKKEYGR